MNNRLITFAIAPREANGRVMGVSERPMLDGTTHTDELGHIIFRKHKRKCRKIQQKQSHASLKKIYSDFRPCIPRRLPRIFWHAMITKSRIRAKKPQATRRSTSSRTSILSFRRKSREGAPQSNARACLGVRAKSHHKVHIMDLLQSFRSREVSLQAIKMAFLFNLFGNKPVAPERVPTDVVIPLFRRDDTRAHRNISLQFTMKFDEVLDAEKLSSALWKLLERPGWKKLGARLRLNDKGKLEYHIPAQYTKERPPINYTHTIESMPISQHPLSAKFPRTNGKLKVFDDLGRVTAKLDTNPELLADYIYSDVAQLGLHIVSFDDGTLVTITWLHTLLDAMGRHALLRAWTAVLEGRDADVPDFLGYETDPLADLGQTDISQQEDLVLKHKFLKGFNMVRFIFNYLWETFWYPVEEGRPIFMPASYFSKLKSQCYEDLETMDSAELTYHNNASGDGNEKPKPFISDGDILTAWLTHLIVSTNPSLTSSPPSRQIAIMNVFGMRDLLRNTSPPLLPSTGALINNCMTAIWSHFQIQDFLAKPLGHIAARIRRDLVQQGTRKQIEAGARLAHQNGGMVLFGSGDMVLSTMSNWSKAKLFDTDFSAAIIKERSKHQEVKVEKNKARGKPTFIHVNAVSGKGFALRGNGNCIGRDNEGNWWLGCILREDFLPGFIRAVESMSG